MKKKTKALQSAEYILLLAGFTQWLQLLNYSPLSIPTHTTSLKDFLRYQEATGKLLLAQLSATDANHFIEYLQIKIGVISASCCSKRHSRTTTSYGTGITIFKHIHFIN